MLELVAVLAAGLAASLIGWPVTSLILRAAASRREKPALAIKQEPAVQDAPAIDSPGLLRGGLWIGLLERFTAAVAIALGQPEVLAVIVALKGLGRFPELRASRAAGERFIIGSLASLAVAGVLGEAARFLVRYA